MRDITRLLTLNISRAKLHLSLWLDFLASPEAPEGTVDGWIGWGCSKARSKDGCEAEGSESCEKICKPKGDNKPSPY